MPPAVRSRASASVTNRWCSANATRRAGEDGADGGERVLGRLAGIDGRDQLARGAVWRGRLGERGGRPADEQDDVVVVAVVPEPGEPRRIGRAQSGERRQARQDEHEPQRDERARPHASASGEGKTVLMPLAGQFLDGMCRSWSPIVVDAGYNNATFGDVDFDSEAILRR